MSVRKAIDVAPFAKENPSGVRQACRNLTSREFEMARRDMDEVKSNVEIVIYGLDQVTDRLKIRLWLIEPQPWRNLGIPW
jgi:hypothetical protein